MSVQQVQPYAIANYTSAFAPTTCSEDLTPCPSSPNCINTEDYDSITNPGLPPIELPPNITTHQLKKVFQTVIDQMRKELFVQKDIWGNYRLRVTRHTGDKLDVEYRTVLGFVDKWTVRVNEGLIQSKFASDTGYFDFGTNARKYHSFYNKVVKLLQN